MRLSENRHEPSYTPGPPKLSIVLPKGEKTSLFSRIIFYLSILVSQPIDDGAYQSAPRQFDATRERYLASLFIVINYEMIHVSGSIKAEDPEKTERSEPSHMPSFYGGLFSATRSFLASYLHSRMGRTTNAQFVSAAIFHSRGFVVSSSFAAVVSCLPFARRFCAGS